MSAPYRSKGQLAKLAKREAASRRYAQVAGGAVVVPPAALYGKSIIQEIRENAKKARRLLAALQSGDLLVASTGGEVSVNDGSGWVRVDDRP